MELLAQNSTLFLTGTFSEINELLMNKLCLQNTKSGEEKTTEISF